MFTWPRRADSDSAAAAATTVPAEQENPEQENSEQEHEAAVQQKDRELFGSTSVDSQRIHLDSRTDQWFQLSARKPGGGSLRKVFKEKETKNPRSRSETRRARGNYKQHTYKQSLRMLHVWRMWFTYQPLLSQKKKTKKRRPLKKKIAKKTKKNAAKKNKSRSKGIYNSHAIHK